MLVMLAESIGLEAQAIGLDPKLSKESAEVRRVPQEGRTRGMYQQWGASKHYRANIGCYECHAAEKTDEDAMNHYGHTIAIAREPEGLRSLPRAKRPRSSIELAPQQGRAHPRFARQRLAEVVEGNGARS